MFARRFAVASPGSGALCLALAVAAGPALAQTPNARDQSDVIVEAPVTLERDVHLFIVQKDGSIVEHDDYVMRANTTAGVDQVAERYVWFNKEAETITNLSAETIGPDDVVHPVGPEGIRDVQEPRPAGAPTFDEGVLRAVIFPGVQPGSRVHLSFGKRRTKPLERGAFAYSVEPTGEPVEFQRLIFDLPADVPLYVDARGYVALPPVTENGRTLYTFDYRHGPYAPLEPGAVGYANWGDRLMVTTLPNFAAFATRYREAAADSSATDPSIAALAQALVAGTNGPREAAARIYDWMRFNIRYVALFLGESATVPHRAVDILRNRYGDCKDHVALFTALLAAAGIRAEAALVNIGPVYTLPAVPGYGDAGINHVVTWLPDLGLFADTTSGGVAFGYLPAGVMDRPALLVDDGVLVRTPATQPHARDAKLAIGVGGDGDATYRYYVEDDGATAELERNTFRRATREAAHQLATQRLRQTGLNGTARITTSAPDATSGPFSTTTEGTLDHFVWPDGTTALPALSSFSGGIATQIDNWLAQPRRTQPWTCIGGEFDESSQIRLPANVRVTDMPHDASVQGAADAPLAYSAHYVFDTASRTVQILRHLTARFGHQMCSAEEFAQMRDALVRIQRDTHAQIVVRAQGG
ncbi:DUF3857 domain-containing transglutaminase family protein [Paraburkholderia dinghuensis]|uniref:DUF3857 domain-containing protein n=1 Tax=Paraburkholderia dinghuensis TaxID=2305225 RepID=A0A3N6PYT1_9BURK|nr:DUF3857 domain-containing transglutaminase family protein [Paraburkholderia dinghuensis]RQH07580.1 DUF3857 domain-containing protein [Paraburkholderia dinghuensis]